MIYIAINKETATIYGVFKDKEKALACAWKNFGEEFGCEVLEWTKEEYYERMGAPWAVCVEKWEVNE